MGNCNCDSNKESFDPKDLVNENVHKRDKSENVIISRAGLKRTGTSDNEENSSHVFEEFKNFMATNNLILVEEDLILFDQNTDNEKTENLNSTVKSFINEVKNNKDEANVENDQKVYFFGNVKFSDGSIYRGTWNRNFQKHGKGILKDEDGIYVGDFNNDCITGKGYYISKIKNVYIGEFINRVAEGEGEVYLNDSPHYHFKGNFKDNKMNGYGIEKLEDNSIYDGEFVDGFKKKGKFSFSNGCIYEGEFINSKFEGYGTYSWPDSRSYEGNFSNNQIHGKGKFKFADGRIYDGEYKNGIKDGKGKVIYPDNDTYYGEWVNDLQHGHFYKTNQDKSKEKSFWRFGKKIKNI